MASWPGGGVVASHKLDTITVLDSFRILMAAINTAFSHTVLPPPLASCHIFCSFSPTVLSRRSQTVLRCFLAFSTTFLILHTTYLHRVLPSNTFMFMCILYLHSTVSCTVEMLASPLNTFNMYKDKKDNFFKASFPVSLCCFLANSFVALCEFFAPYPINPLL